MEKKKGKDYEKSYIRGTLHCIAGYPVRRRKKLQKMLVTGYRESFDKVLRNYADSIGFSYDIDRRVDVEEPVCKLTFADRYIEFKFTYTREKDALIPLTVDLNGRFIRRFTEIRLLI